MASASSIPFVKPRIFFPWFFYKKNASYDLFLCSDNYILKAFPVYIPCESIHFHLGCYMLPPLGYDVLAMLTLCQAIWLSKRSPMDSIEVAPKHLRCGPHHILVWCDT